MNLPQNIVPFVAHSPKAEALENIDVLQNLEFLIEQQSDTPEDVRAYVQSMHLVLDGFARRFRMPSAHLPEPEPAHLVLSASSIKQQQWAGMLNSA